MQSANDIFKSRCRISKGEKGKSAEIVLFSQQLLVSVAVENSERSHPIVELNIIPLPISALLVYSFALTVLSQFSSAAPLAAMSCVPK